MSDADCTPGREPRSVAANHIKFGTGVGERAQAAQLSFHQETGGG